MGVSATGSTDSAARMRPESGLAAARKEEDVPCHASTVERRCRHPYPRPRCEMPARVLAQFVKFAAARAILKPLPDSMCVHSTPSSFEVQRIPWASRLWP